MRVLVTGAGGGVGSELVAELERRNRVRTKHLIDVVAANHGALDVTSRDAVLAAVTTIQPDVVINAAGGTAVDRCESEPEPAYAVNAMGTRNLAEAARAAGAHLLHISTDYVFDGTKDAPYNEWDVPNPLSVYGKSKLAGERALGPDATLVRISWVCGRYGGNMVKTVLRLLESGQRPLRFVDDQHGRPTLVPDLAPLLVDLALTRRPGTFHATNQGTTTWFGFVRAVVEFAGGDPAIVEPITTSELDSARYPAPRPANSVLDDLALRLASIDLLPEWEASTRALVAELLA